MKNRKIQPLGVCSPVQACASSTIDHQPCLDPPIAELHDGLSCLLFVKVYWRKERVLAPAQKHKIGNTSTHMWVLRSNELTQVKKCQHL